MTDNSVPTKKSFIAFLFDTNHDFLHARMCTDRLVNKNY